VWVWLLLPGHGEEFERPPARSGGVPTWISSTPAGAALALGLALALAPAEASASPAARNPRADTVRRVFPSAVRLEIAVGGEVVRSASGVAFARAAGRSYVLTNAHVVEPSASWKGTMEARVLGADGKIRIAARVVARGQAPENDLAVLEVTAELPITPLAPDDALELGDDLVVIGAPFGKGLSVAAGIVSQVEYAFVENAAAPPAPKALKTDAAIGYGSSGGGVFDVPAGRLVGLVEGYRTARVAFGGKEKDAERYAFDVPMPGETFVAPAAKIRRFLGEHGLAQLAGGPAREGAPPAGPVFAPAAL